MTKKGFTLIELILYVAIVTIMITALIPFAWNVIGSGAVSSTQQELSSNARFVSEKIKSEIRRASGISSITTTTLSLTNFLPDTTTVISYNATSGKVRINKNGNGEVDLNSDDTKITSFTFTDFSSGSLTKHVQYTFTIQDNFSSARSEYTGTVNIEGSAEVRSL